MAGALLVLVAGCGGPGPVAVRAPSLDAADARTCRALLDALPATVADGEAREVTPEGVLGAAWGDPAIVLTCGVPVPRGFDTLSSCTVVDGVDWYLPQDQLESPDPGDTTWTVVNREVAVRVLLPEEYGVPAAMLADLSPVVARAVPAKPSGLCA